MLMKDSDDSSESESLWISSSPKQPKMLSKQQNLTDMSLKEIKLGEKKKDPELYLNI